MELILSTKNRTKIEQIKAALSGLNITVLSLEDAGILGEAVEDGNTLEENALKKAAFAQQKSGAWAIADDTGLFIDALGGKPGIYAGRWAEHELGRKLPTEEIMRFVLEKLAHIPYPARTATFKTVAALVSPTGEEKTFIGSVSGIILTEPRTVCQPNMPYSSLFQPHGHDKVWAEMSVEEENIVSHRGKAFKQLRDFLASI